MALPKMLESQKISNESLVAAMKGDIWYGSRYECSYVHVEVAVVLHVVICVVKVVSTLHSWSGSHCTRGYRECSTSTGSVVSSGLGRAANRTERTGTKRLAGWPATLTRWLQDADHVECLLEAVEDLIIVVRIYRSVLVRAIAVHVGRAEEAVWRKGDGYVVFVWIRVVVVVVVVMGMQVGLYLTRVIVWGDLGGWSAEIAVVRQVRMGRDRQSRIFGFRSVDILSHTRRYTTHSSMHDRRQLLDRQ